MPPPTPSCPTMRDIAGPGSLVGDGIATATRTVIRSLWRELIYCVFHLFLFVIFHPTDMTPVIVVPLPQPIRGLPDTGIL